MTNGSNGPSENSLIATLEQNLLHAQHVENHRFWISNVHWLAVAAFGAFIVDKGITSGAAMAALVVLFIFSLNVYLLVIKLNEEFANHYRAVQWTAEKLQVIRPLKNNELKKLDASMKDKVMFRGFLALPLPLRIRVHRVFSTSISLLITATTFSCLLYSFLGWGKYLEPKSDPAIFASVGAFAAVAALMYYLVHRPADKTRRAILRERRPDNIKIEYPESPLK